jgi:hypothetical protein
MKMSGGVMRSADPPFEKLFGESLVEKIFILVDEAA